MRDHVLEQFFEVIIEGILGLFIIFFILSSIRIFYHFNLYILALKIHFPPKFTWGEIQKSLFSE